MQFRKRVKVQSRSPHLEILLGIWNHDPLSRPPYQIVHHHPNMSLFTHRQHPHLTHFTLVILPSLDRGPRVYHILMRFGRVQNYLCSETFLYQLLLAVFD